MGSDMLAGRLKALEEGGILRRTVLPTAAGSRVYELTELGRSPAPVTAERARSGSRLPATPRGEDDLRPAWAAVALRAVFDTEAACGLRET